MQLEELKTFVTVVNEKNFTRAGIKLNIAQPTVSLHIRNLEEQLNVPLLVRSNKSFHITPEGQLLYERAMQLLNLAEETKEEILWLHQEVSGKLRIAASYTIGESIIPEVLAHLHSQYPKIFVEVSIANTEDVEKAVRELRCDVGCIEGRITSNDVTITPFMEDELILVVAASHPFARYPSIDSSVLEHAHWVLREKGSGTRQYTDFLLRSIGQLKPSCTIIGSNEGVKQAVLHGLGIAAVSYHTVKKELERGELVVLNADVLPQHRIFSTLHSTLLEEKRIVQVFLEALQQYNA